MLSLLTMIAASEGVATTHSAGIPSLQSMVWLALVGLILVVAWIIKQWIAGVKLEMREQKEHTTAMEREQRDKNHALSNSLQVAILDITNLKATSADKDSLHALELKIVSTINTGLAEMEK